MKNKAYSLHIGLNKVNPPNYRGWEGPLSSCEADAEAMERIAQSLHYEKTILLRTTDATAEAFFKNAVEIRDQLNPGDLFLLTFSGHGGQVLDTNGDERVVDWEGKSYDQTWCFYDRQVVDDEIHGFLKTIKEGVRVLIISDSCFSGSIIKAPDASLMWGQTKRISLGGVTASVRLIASSQDTQLSRSGRSHGLFTTALLKVWDKGSFKGNYKAFYKAIVSLIPYNYKQTPNHLMAGAEDEGFDEGRPFVV